MATAQQKQQMLLNIPFGGHFHFGPACTAQEQSSVQCANPNCVPHHPGKEVTCVPITIWGITGCICVHHTGANASGAEPL
jgi:hypothetical protein